MTNVSFSPVAAVQAVMCAVPLSLKEGAPWKAQLPSGVGEFPLDIRGFIKTCPSAHSINTTGPPPAPGNGECQQKEATKQKRKHTRAHVTRMAPRKLKVA